MKLVSVHTDLLQKYKDDKEVLVKAQRPYVLVLRLKYKGKNYPFAIPLRSNISASTPREQYFSLPPRPSTKPKNHHGLHYIKMFPISKEYLIRYRTEGNQFATMIQNIIDKNEKKIVTACQSYLDDYAEGKRLPFSTDIDYLLSQLYPCKDVSE